MKKIQIIITAGALALAACSQPAAQSKQAKPAADKQAKCKYTCTMHKDVCSEKPGICPKCGMELVEKQ